MMRERHQRAMWPFQDRVAPVSLAPVMEGNHLSLRSAAAVADNEWIGFDGEMLDFIRGHVRSCASCAARVEALVTASEAASRLLQHLDAPVPGISARSVIGRARSRRLLLHYRTAAAVAVFAGAAVAAAALPSSPFHQRIVLAFEALVPVGARGPATSKRPVQPAEQQQQQQQQRGAVAMTPAQRLDVVFSEAQAAGTIHIRFADVPEATVSSRESSGSYRVSESRIIVMNARSGGDYELVLPRTLRHATVRIGNVVVFARDADNVTAVVPRDASGGYMISLAR